MLFRSNLMVFGVVLLFSPVSLGLAIGGDGPMDIAPRNVECTTVASGPLSTNYRLATGTYAHFALNSAHEIAYFPNKTKPDIQAEFQMCTPNYYGSNNNGTLQNYLIKYRGRIYLPELNRCIGVENAYSNSATYYYPKVVPCVPLHEIATKKSIPQNFAYAESDDLKFMYWTGASTPTKDQGGCYWGLLGYTMTFPGAEPVTSKASNYRVTYECDKSDSSGAGSAASFR
ncbi:hypothetical protein DL93DRAFT_1888933 [Clavulina sp. PMI_390]|nr:hypothetical protein DL93DRAFT_1888933 [Clavulina sp. PMI_390]